MAALDISQSYIFHGIEREKSRVCSLIKANKPETVQYRASTYSFLLSHGRISSWMYICTHGSPFCLFFKHMHLVEILIHLLYCDNKYKKNESTEVQTLGIIRIQL